MISAIALVLFYAVIAAASAVAFTVTVVILGNDRARSTGAAWAIGFVAGTLAACLLGLLLGGAAVDRLDSHQTLEAVLALLLGVALVVVALRAARDSDRPRTEERQRGRIVARLDDVQPPAALTVGGLLGLGGPKRLVLTYLAMASISDSDVGDVERLTLVVIYIAVSTVVVTVPVTMVAIGGGRATRLLGRVESQMKSHARIRRRLALGAGIALVVDGLVRLVL